LYCVYRLLKPPPKSNELDLTGLESGFYNPSRT